MAETDEQKNAHYPCPACGATLYGWTAAHDPLDRGERIVLDRCENCGLAVTRRPEPPDAEAEIHHLIERNEHGRVEIVAPNRKSFQGGLGGAQWAGLEPELRRLHLTPEALRLLLAKQGLDLVDVGTPFRSRSYKLMWQTIVNAFTYRDNFVRNYRAGRFPKPGTTKDKLLYGIDWVVSVLVAIPAAIIALPLELVATVCARGGMLTADAEPIEDRPVD
jgi:predicted RNA-binding Zn-ribbon protein involved in translation (DUF1610 family)